MVYDFVVRETEDHPEFDHESVNQDTLEMSTDEVGAWYLSPLTLRCTEEWSKTLPSIKTEDDGKRLDLTVDLGPA